MVSQKNEQEIENKYTKYTKIQKYKKERGYYTKEKKREP